MITKIYYITDKNNISKIRGPVLDVIDMTQKMHAQGGNREDSSLLIYLKFCEITCLLQKGKKRDLKSENQIYLCYVYVDINRFNVLVE